MSKALAKQEENLSVTIVRPELNLEKWPAIWTPAQSRTKAKLRVLERKSTLDNGNIIFCKVTINPSLQYGNLTTEDQKTWYGLLQLWEKAGKPQILVFSLRELARTLSKSWSIKTYESLKKSLKRLNISAFAWENSYYDSKTKKTLELEDSFHIISELRLAKVSEEHSVNNEQCSCRFSDLLYQNLLNNYTKPICFTEILKIKSGVAQLVYKYLELVMYDKTYYERKTENLFYDIGLEGEEYKFASARKRILLTAIEELKEIPFPGGTLEVGIEETTDKSDWKLTVKKISIEASKPKKTSKPKEPKQELLKDQPSLKDQTLSYFLERFGLRREPSKAEFEKAEQLIQKHQLSFEMVKNIIDYAKCAAVETNYTPKNFSGIIQYAEEALAQHQAKHSQSKVKEEITKCCFCNADGFIGVIDAFGRRATMRCPHNSEALKTKAARENIKFDFWSSTPPNFTY